MQARLLLKINCNVFIDTIKSGQKINNYLNENSICFYLPTPGMRFGHV